MDNEIKIDITPLDKQVSEVFDKELTYEDIMRNLKNPDTDDFIKIFSIINLSEIKSQNDFDIIINHLTNHPTPIREALAIKLEQIYPLFEEFYIKNKNQFLNAIIDINPNVSRAVCSLLNKSFILASNLEEDVILKIEELLLEIKQFEIKNNDYFCDDKQNQKNHAKNKKLFSLYWLLKALSIILSDKFEDKVTKILRTTINFADYTIREKTAKILIKMKNSDKELLSVIKQDQNFYVKNQVYDRINLEDFN